MLRIDPHTKTLAPLGRRTLQPVSVLKRYALADLIAGNPRDFFADLGLSIEMLSADFELASGRRILLAADPDGRTYVIATQHKSHGLDLIEPLEDASQVARCSGRQLLERLPLERRNAIRAFLQTPADNLNQEQGVLLVGESFDLETLAAAGWLRRRYNVHILCFRARMAVEPVTGEEFLACRDLSEEVERLYLQQQSGEDDGAPWPTIDPDAAIRPQSELEQPPAEPRAAAALQADVAEALVDEDDGAPMPVEIGDLDGEIEDVEASPGDPLDELEASQSLVPLPAEQGRQDQEEAERRYAERRSDLQARRLRLDYFGKLLGARLVDFSSKGVGVEALSPLPIGAEVGISGELIGRDGSLDLDGRVKVKHCRTGEDGVSRIGLELDKSALRVTPNQEFPNQEFFDRR